MLTLHAGARAVSYEELLASPTPPATESHLPVPHHEIVEGLRYTLGFYGHEVAEEHHALMPDGMRYFGLMTLRSSYGDYSDVVGLRNSHDKSFPIGIAFGSRVFVCDNTAFIGEHVIRRKHTTRAKRELPGLIAEIIAPLKAMRVAQNKQLQAYQRTSIDDATADHLILEMFRKGVISLLRVAQVLKEWNAPSHDWGRKTAWRLFNAATVALEGKAVERPALTEQLHQIMDQACS